jgi:hypothetical protein
MNEEKQPKVNVRRYVIVLLYWNVGMISSVCIDFFIYYILSEVGIASTITS